MALLHRAVSEQWILVAPLVVGVIGADLGKEDNKEQSALSFGIGATLLGAVSFMMCLVYFTNHPDKDMKRYTYEMITQVTAIFCAVLVFDAVNSCVEIYMNLAEKSYEQQALVDCCHMLVWFLLLQFVLAMFSGALSEWGFTPKNVQTANDNLKAFGVLLAHITGFASINAFGTLQQMLHDEFGVAWVAIAAAAMSLLCLTRATKILREKVSLGDDGVEDEWESLWDEQTAEAEQDVLGLTMSFLTINIARQLICGSLPDPDGDEPWTMLVSHPARQMYELLGVGLVAALMAFLLRVYQPHHLAGHQHSLYLLTMGTFNAMASWAFFFGFTWYIASWHLEDPVVLKVIVAASLFFGTFLVMWIFDKLADADWTPEAVDNGIIAFIESLAVMVGFAWEQAFFQSTKDLAEMSPRPTETRTFLALMCVVILVPAWRWYVIPILTREGWKFGFIIDHEDEESVMELLKHKGFASAIENVKNKHGKYSHAEFSRAKSVARFAAAVNGEDKKVAPEGYSHLPKCDVEAMQERNTELENCIGQLEARNEQLNSELERTVRSYHSRMEEMHRIMLNLTSDATGVKWSPRINFGWSPRTNLGWAGKNPVET